MEIKDLNLNLRLLCEIKMSLEQGKAIHSALKSYRDKYRDEVSEFLGRWEAQLTGNLNLRVQNVAGFDSLRFASRNILLLAERSLRGESILPALREFEADLLKLLHSEAEEHAAKLPVYLTLPLVGLIFPALMLLVLGPFVTDLINGLSR